MRRHRLVIDPEKPEQCEKSTPPTHEIIREIHRQIICDTTTASAGSPATMCSTAAFRSTERYRITSSIRAVAMPARCSRRNGWPAATERS